MSTKRTSILSSKSIQIESIKNIFESIAFVVAAIWAVLSFLIKDGPTLEKSASINGDLSIESVDSTKVHVNFFVIIKNDGKSAFEITKPTKVRLWLIPIKTLTEKTHFDWTSYMKRKATDSILDTVFSNRYAPENEVRYGFDFYVDKDPNQAVLVKIDAGLEAGKSWWEFWKWFAKKEEWPDYCFATKTRCIPEKTTNIEVKKE